MSDSKYREIFRKNFVYYMNKAGKKQTDIVKQLGISKSAVSLWIKGENIPRPERIDQLAKFLGCTPSDLTEDRTATPQDEEARIRAVARAVASDEQLLALFMKMKDYSEEEVKKASAMLDLLRGNICG